MLKEIPGGRRSRQGVTRRWFQSDWFDLFLWVRGGEILRFQLSYDRQGNEHLLAWDQKQGTTHHAVDAGEENPRSNMSPLLLPDGIFPCQTVLPRFRAESIHMEPALRAALLARLNAPAEAAPAAAPSSSVPPS